MSAQADSELAELIFDHLCEEQPEAVADLRDAEILRRVHLGIERAGAHDLTTDGAVTAFVTLMFLVGPAFDQQPNIRKFLAESKLPADERMTQIFAKTQEEDWDQAAAQPGSWKDLE